MIVGVNSDSVDAERPSQLKLIEFEDMKHYLNKYDKGVTVSFLRRYNFTMSEIKWLKKNKPEFFVDEVEGDTMKDKKTELQDENQRLKTELKQKNDLIKKLKSVFTPRVEVIQHDDYYVHKKHKHIYKPDTDSFKSRTESFSVDKRRVDDLKRIIGFLTAKDSYTIYYDIVKLLIIDNKLNVSVSEFNGGKNRSKYMFPYYYKPLQVLKYYGVVEVDNKNRIYFVG